MHPYLPGGPLLTTTHTYTSILRTVRTYWGCAKNKPSAAATGADIESCVFWCVCRKSFARDSNTSSDTTLLLACRPSGTTLVYSSRYNQYNHLDWRHKQTTNRYGVRLPAVVPGTWTLPNTFTNTQTFNHESWYWTSSVLCLSRLFYSFSATWARLFSKSWRVFLSAKRRSILALMLSQRLDTDPKFDLPIKQRSYTTKHKHGKVCQGPIL